MSWTAAQRLQKRREYDRLYRSGETVTGRNPRMVIPEDIERFEGVPEPCFLCGSGRALCKHRVA